MITIPYSEFTLKRVKTELHIELLEEKGIFSAIKPTGPSELLVKNLEENIPLALAINTEKARSELIIAPVLVEVKRRLHNKASVFSGVEFNVDKKKGLGGFCDFILSGSPKQLMLSAPIITVVEAKNENIIGGLGQCIAEMVAAQLFNQKEGGQLKQVYGVVTSGNIWRFLKITQQEVHIDLQDYYIEHVEKILGVLIAMMQQKA